MRLKKHYRISQYMKLPKSLIILIIIAIFSAGTYFFYTEGSLPVNKNDKSPTIFVVEQGENLETISKHLENNDLIRSKLIFYLIVKKLGIEKRFNMANSGYHNPWVLKKLRKL
jgi:cell division protein YceG involved in septum cleavage